MARTERIAMAAGAAGIMTGRLLLVHFRRTVSGCTTCTGMSGSGWRTAGMTTIQGRLRMGAPGQPAVIVVAAFCAAVPGTAFRGTSVPHTAAGTAPETATTTTGFELPGRSLLESLLPYLRGPGAEPPAGFFKFPVLDTGGTQCPVSEGVRLSRVDEPGWSGREADGPSDGGRRPGDRAGAGSPLPFRAVAGAGSGTLSEKPEVPLGRPDAGRGPGRAGKPGRGHIYAQQDKPPGTREPRSRKTAFPVPSGPGPGLSRPAPLRTCRSAYR